MCKLAIIPHIQAGKEAKAFKLAEALTGHLTERDNDGFGYVALGDAGLFGERWLDPSYAWGKAAPDALRQYAHVLNAPSMAEANSYGTRTKRVYGLALHARMATCDVSLQNVHPFVNETATVGLVHNGVINNSAAFPARLSTCDSESILTQYEAHSVPDSFRAIQQATSELTGWYAVAAYSRDSAGRWYLDIFKESRSKLFCGYVNAIGGVVFVTNPDHLEDACAELKYKHSEIIEVTHNTAMRHDGKTGLLLETLELTPAQAYPPFPKSGTWMNEIDDAPSYREDYAAIDDHDDTYDLVDELADPFSVKVRKGA